MAIFDPLLQRIMVLVINGSLTSGVLHLSLDGTALVSTDIGVRALFLHSFVVE